jgi:sec-independent protein translocase protein TatA
MGLSTTHILLLLIVVVLLFGRGKISELMGDVAKGIKSFKKGMAEDDVAGDSAKGIEHARTPEAGRTDTTKTG